jgi:very-short-patch-repair endonuclease
MAALNQVARLHGVTADDLRAQLPRFRRRRGVIQLRELAQLIEPRVESARESWTWLEIHDAGLPMPEPQVWIEIGGVPTYRLDFAYERRRIAIEYDGAEFHDSTDDQRRYDADRRAWLRKNGWTVIVIRSGDFTGERRDRWIRELRLALSTTYDNRRW